MCWAYRILKTNREENLTKHVYPYVKKAKNRKLMTRKVAKSRKSRLIIDNEKQGAFHFVSI